MYVRSLNGDEYPAQITYTVESEINTNPIMSATIQPTKANLAFLEDMSEVWHIVDDNDTVYVPIYFKKKGIGQHMQADIKAIPLFFDEMNVQRIYERYDSSFMASAYFELIFADSGYGFILHDHFDSLSFQGVGEGATRLDEFKRGIERYGIEFEIVGATVHLRRLIGNDTQFRYEYRLNASNIVQEVDANELWTYARGYGDYGDGEGGEDWQNAKLLREYTSPLASLIGKRDAPPIKNGNITTTSTMDEQLQILVNDSLKISATADIHSLEKQGYPIAQAQLGDRSFLIDERIDFDEEVRVVRKRETRNWKGELIGLDLTFGSPGIVRRHQSKLESARKEITDFLAGKIKLPYSAYDDAVLRATRIIVNDDANFEYAAGYVLGVNKDNPNLLTRLTSQGLGISSDGGATFPNAITGEGVVAEAIVGESIFGVNIASANGESTMWIQGGDVRLTDIVSGQNLNLNPRGMTGFDDGGNILFQANRTWVTAGILGTNTTNVYLAAQSGGEARIVDIAGIPGDGLIASYNYLPIRASALYANRWNINPASGNNPINLYASPLTNGELRVTLNDTVDSYRDARVRTIYANTISRNTLSSSSPHLYTQPAVDGEIRATAEGTTETYVPVRAKGYFGEYFDTTATHAYIRPAGDPGELRVTVRNTTNVYQPVRAKEFVTDTSVREKKTNIDVYEGDTLSTVRNSSAYLYNRQTDKEGARKQLGLMIDELPEVTHSEAGDSFGIYALSAFHLKTDKDLLAEIDKLKARVSALESA